ncbi:MAG: hypothetical protein RXO32_10740 [Thermoproteus sp.]
MNKSSRRMLAAVLLAFAAALTLYGLYSGVLTLTLGNTSAKLPPPRPPAAAGQVPGGGGTLSFAVGLIALAVLAMVMGLGLISVVLAVVISIAVIQQAGWSFGDVLPLALAAGLGLSSIRARPMVQMPRALAMLLAFVAAVGVSMSDMTPLVTAFQQAGTYFAQAIVSMIQQAAQNTYLVAVVMVLGLTYLARGVARARGLAGLALSFIVAFAANVIGAQLLQLLQQQVTMGVASIVITLASVIALVDIFTALERGRIDSIVWVGALSILASASFQINLAPVVALFSALSAFIAAFTLREEYANIAIVLALAGVGTQSYFTPPTWP